MDSSSPNRRNGSPLRRARRASASSADGAVATSPARAAQQTSRLYPVTSRPNLQPRESAIRLRRLPSGQVGRLETIPSLRQQNQQQQEEQHEQLEQDMRRQALENEWQANRRRSSSEPHRPTFDVGELTRARTGINNMPSVPELPQNNNTDATAFEPTQPARPGLANGSGRFRRASVAALNGLGLHRNADDAQQPPHQALPENLYDSRIVDLLDVIDPEVSALSSLTNIQNSLFVPQLGRFVNRRPTYDLSRLPAYPAAASRPQTSSREKQGEFEATAAGGPPVRPLQHMPTMPELRPVGSAERPRTSADRPGTPSERAFSITSALSESRYAVLPHGITLDGWTEEDKAELNDYVRHMLHSRRSRFKRSLKGFGKYVSKPLGFLVTLYATLITLFGLAWVLFLIGWIYVGDRQHYIINIIDNVLVALFAIVGDGLAPFRAVDTYHMIFIAHYHRKTWKLRKEKALPKLQDKNDLPNEQVPPDTDVEASRHEQEELSVLNPKQQATLVHHQEKFAKSHTFYKPHETDTHFAFPLRLLIVIVTLLDCHSCLQIALGACTWGIDYHVRPGALTAVILCCSITVNITAGILISVGDRRTRKKDVIERMSRQELTEEAIHKMQRRQEKHDERLRRLEETGEETDLEDNKEKKGRMSLDLFGSKRSEDRPRRSFDVLRKTEDNSRRSLDVSRKSEDRPRRSLNIIQKTDEPPPRISEADSRPDLGDVDVTTAAEDHR
ncbi:putative integral membrane protein [Diplodia seriata]|uniref:Putative integral membrane protein n=1 Tax=Diplodia seriata TaxID=420778 RepID=A0A0G2EBC4_9PEZI|nr:putative integral membrane protein [Diplodia seriata]